MCLGTVIKCLQMAITFLPEQTIALRVFFLPKIDDGFLSLLNILFILFFLFMVCASKVRNILGIQVHLAPLGYGMQTKQSVKLKR